MDTRALTSEALILRGRDYGEADRILVVLTKDRGKLSLIAKGVRKPKSHLKAASQLFCHSRISVSGGRGSSGLGVLSQGEVLDSLMELRLDLDKIACASYVGEMIDLALPREKPNEEMFLLALTTLTLLSMTDEYFLVLQWFNLRLLAILGYRPRLDACVQCGRGLRQAEFLLAPDRGGLICKSCAKRPAPPVSGAVIAILDKFLNWDIRSLLKLRLNRETKLMLENAVYAYLDYYLERSVKARTALRQYIPEL
jgi:DNA repair protein RecO (recombination protein O)